MSYIKPLFLALAFLALSFASNQAQAQIINDTLIFVKAPLRTFVTQHFQHIYQGQTEAAAQDFQVKPSRIFNDTIMVFKGAGYLKPSQIKSVRMGSGEGQNMVFVHISAAVGERMPHDQMRRRQVAAYAQKNGLDPRRTVALKVAGTNARSYRVVR